VHEGLKRLPERADIVAVHDGARPLITPEQIGRCIAKARECGAVACARPVTETLKRVDGRGVIAGNLEREGAWVMETPQVFERALLCRAYDSVVREGMPVTDEVSAVQQVGGEVFVLDNPHPNLKITYPADLELAAKILAARP
jgi:2-C-methyl-D-erythritol 4-phosphate cytidylyltransferase